MTTSHCQLHLQVLCFSKAEQKGGDDVNANFSKLLSELIKKGPPYSLSLANRLFGEQTLQFVQVSLKTALGNFC